MGVPYREVAHRLRIAGRCKNDSALARALEVTPQALSNYKKRGELPSDLAIRAAEKFGVSLDWAIKGEGEGPNLADVFDMPGCGQLQEEPVPTSLSIAIEPDEARWIMIVLNTMRETKKELAAESVGLLEKSRVFGPAMHP